MCIYILTFTREGEKVNSLCEEAENLIIHVMSTIENNAQVYYGNGGECYECSQTEIQQLKDFLNSLPRIHDEINNEMGINSPGIVRARLFQPLRAQLNQPM